MVTKCLDNQQLLSNEIYLLLIHYLLPKTLSTAKIRIDQICTRWYTRKTLMTLIQKSDTDAEDSLSMLKYDEILLLLLTEILLLLLTE